MSDGKVQIDKYGIARPFPDGIPIRDWFAGQALGGLIASDMWHAAARRDCGHDGASVFMHDSYAKHAYLMADAMLAEREKNR